MVFGFFTKKQQTQTDVPMPDSPRPPSENAVQDGKDVSQQPEIHTQVEQLQLRTPSPSVVDSVSAAQATRYPSEVPSSGLGPEATRPPVEPTPESLSTLLSSVPAKIVHDYTLAQLPTTTQPTLDALASFFALLTPPPKLHCVRCHKDFVEVENGDRSCLVPHDDDSAEVERVGRTGHERRTKEGTEYETLWGCCGKTTEGDGSQGPPDGWCYEGKHTVCVYICFCHFHTNDVANRPTLNALVSAQTRPYKTTNSSHASVSTVMAFVRACPARRARANAHGKLTKKNRPKKRTRAKARRTAASTRSWAKQRR